MTSEDLLKVHEYGVARFGDKWYHANRRAVEVLWGTRLRADSPEVKKAIPLLLFKVLCGMMLDQGKVWSKESKTWVSRT
jgi:hypothetical protein